MTTNTCVDFSHPVFANESSGYIKSIQYEISHGYFVVIHIFTEWEYIEVAANCERGGSSSIHMNIENGANKFLDAFTDINSQIKKYREAQ
jgi:hypothetical protein